MVIVAFHVPLVFNDDEQVPPPLMRWLLDRVAQITGGWTAFEAHGGWLSQGRMRVEPVLRVVAACPEEEVERLVEMVQNILTEDFGQEAVYMEIDGTPSIR